MTARATSLTRRTQRLLAAACASLLSIAALAASGDELRLCPECGRESADAAESFCSHCGAALPQTAGADADAGAPANDDPAVTAIANATPGAKAAAQDLAEARRRRAGGDWAAAFVLCRNAQALLAAQVGEKPSAAAARTISEEAEAARREFDGHAAPSRRQAAASDGMRAAETFFRSSGRIRLGNVWIPADWATSLPPQAIAAARHAIPPQCAECAGAGKKTCRSCAGSGYVPCKAKGCVGGRVARKPANTLSPKTEITVREPCPVCRGAARVACGACAGRGSEPCRKCGGSGDAPLCRGCAGSGLEDCRSCQRNGVDPNCPACHGTGKALCRKCGGDGRTLR